MKPGTDSARQPITMTMNCSVAARLINIKETAANAESAETLGTCQYRDRTSTAEPLAKAWRSENIIQARLSLFVLSWLRVTKDILSFGCAMTSTRVKNAWIRIYFMSWAERRSCLNRRILRRAFIREMIRAFMRSKLNCQKVRKTFPFLRIFLKLNFRFWMPTLRVAVEVCGWK